MPEDVLDELAELERAQRGVIDVVVAGHARVETGVALLVELSDADEQRLRELLEPLDNDKIVEALDV